MKVTTKAVAPAITIELTGEEAQRLHTFLFISTLWSSTTDEEKQLAFIDGLPGELEQALERLKVMWMTCNGKLDT